MAVIRIDLEVDASGAAKINQVGGQLKDLEGKGKAAAGALTSVFQGIGQGIGQELYGALKSVASGILGASSAAIAYGGHLKDVEARTAVAVEAQQELDHAAKLVGLSFEDIVPSLGKMQQALVDTPEKFARLGLAAKDLRAMKPEDQFQAIAEKIAGIADPAERSAAAISIFGKAGTTLLPLLTSNIAAAREEAQRLGLVMSGEVAAAADDMGDSIDTLTAVWDGLIRNFGAAIVTSEPLHQLIQGLTEIIGQLSGDVNDSQGAMRAFVDGGVLIVAQGLGLLISVIGGVIDVWTVLQIGVIAVKGAFEQAAVGVGIWRDVLNGTLSPMKAVEELQKRQADSLRRTYQEIQAEITANTERQNKVAMVGAAVDKLTTAIRNSDGVVHKATETERQHTAALGATTEALKEQERERERIAKIVADTADKNRLDAVKTINKQIEDEYKKNVKIIQDILDKGAEDEARQNEIEARGLEGRIRLLEKEADKYTQVADAASSLAGVLGGTLGSVLSGVAGIFDGLAAHTQQAADNLAKYGTTAMTTAQKVAGLAGGITALISAYNGGKASKSPGKGAMSGAAKGAAAGAAFGPYGIVIGGVIGGVAGYLGGKKGQGEELKGLRQEFDALMAQARQAGIVFDHTFNPRNAQQYKAAIDEVKRSLDLKAEADQKLQDAIDRYGFTIEELGPKMAKQKLDEQAMQLYEDWKLLTAAGVDHGAMLDKVGPKVGELVDHYINAGTEIPSAMKPIIDDLYTHHKLLHENGEEYTEAEYKGITYASTMSQMFQDLIKKVNDLISALLGIPNTQSTHTIHVVHEGGEEGGEEGGGGGRSRRRTEAAMGFHGLVTGPQLFLAGERGAERVDIGPADGGSGMTEATGQQLLTELRRMPRAIARATKAAVALA